MFVYIYYTVKRGDFASFWTCFVHRNHERSELVLFSLSLEVPMIAETENLNKNLFKFI